jgi:DNA repair ATPase RecN
MTEDLRDVVNAPNETARVERLVHHIQRISDGVGEMKAAMREMAAAINRLAVIEERQNQDRVALERAFSAISDLSKKHDQAITRTMEIVDKIDGRMRALEMAQPMQSKVAEWVEKALFAAAAAAVMFVAGKAGLF